MKGKNQYRVMQRGREFFPQVKKLFFWRDIKVPHAAFPSERREWARPRLFFRCQEVTLVSNQPRIEYKIRAYKTLDEAVKSIHKYEELKRPINYKGHKIIPTMNGYYIDTSVNTYIGEFTGILYMMYDSNLGALKHKIDEFENDWTVAKTRKIFNI